MKFLSKEDGEVCDLEIHGAEDGGIDVVRREVVFEKHYKHYNDIYEDFDDYFPEGKNYDPAEISLCKNCWCMTHTLAGNKCGKCHHPKHIIESDYYGKS